MLLSNLSLACELGQKGGKTKCVANERLKYQFTKDSLLSARYFEYVDIFKEIIIQQELCATIHRPFKGDGKLHVSAPHCASLYFVALCPSIN